MYGSTHSLEIKQELVMRYLYVVKSIALQMLMYISAFRRWKILSTRRACDHECDPKFDAKRCGFETYISKRIKGIDLSISMRKQDWVPRSRKSARDIEDAVTII